MTSFSETFKLRGFLLYLFCVPTPTHGLMIPEISRIMSRLASRGRVLCGSDLGGQSISTELQAGSRSPKSMRTALWILGVVLGGDFPDSYAPHTSIFQYAVHEARRRATPHRLIRGPRPRDYLDS